MARDFLAFWRLNTLDTSLRRASLLNYAASNQYSRVKEGDTVWLVSVRSGRLRLIGRIEVASVVDREVAERETGTSNLWDADYYILPVAGTIRKVMDIDIHDLVPQLEFASATSKLSQDERGHVNGQQLQQMRVLGSNSPQLLAEALDRS